MTVADLFFVHQRGLMNTIYIWAYNVGSNLAVVASGFITDGFGWRWVWWFCAIFFGVQFLMFFFGFEETKYSVVSSLLGGRGMSLSGQGDIKNIRNENEKGMRAKSTTPTSDIEAGAINDDVDAARNLNVVHLDPNIPRKTYWQQLSLLKTTPAHGPTSCATPTNPS